MAELLFLLIAAHAVCDYPLQGDFLAKAKNHTTPIPGVPWWIALVMHSLIHGGAVAILTGTWVLGLVETVLHIGIDHAKCRGWTGLGADQALHIGCKIAYVAILAWGIA